MARIVTSDYILLLDGAVELQPSWSPGSQPPAANPLRLSVSVGNTVVHTERPAVVMWRMHVVDGDELSYRVSWDIAAEAGRDIWSTPRGGLTGNHMTSVQEVAPGWPIDAGRRIEFYRAGGRGQLFVSDVVLFYGRLARI